MKGLLACKNYDILKTHKSGCTLKAVHITSMVTGHNRFSVIESCFLQDCSTSIAETGYPELLDLSDSLVPSYKYTYNCTLHLSKDQPEDGPTNRAETCQWNYYVI